MTINLLSVEMLPCDEALKAAERLAGCVEALTIQHVTPVLSTIHIELSYSVYYMLAKKDSKLRIADIDFYAPSIPANYVQWLTQGADTREKRVLRYFGGRMHECYEKESRFLSRAKEFCNMLGEDCLVIREATATKNGVSDIIVCYRGAFVACELKAVGGTPSPQQIKFIDKVLQAGGRAGICESLADVWRIISGTTKAPNL